jgi:hypothetical protein
MNTQIKNSAFLPVNSPEYKAFISIGFKFQNLKHEYNSVRGKLICMCGRTESFTQKITKGLKEDGAHCFNYTLNQFLLDDAHLLEDGYTPEQIAGIRKKYNDLHQHAPHR